MSEAIRKSASKAGETHVVNPPERIDPLFNECFLRVFGAEASRTVTRSLVNSILRKVGIAELGEIDRISAEHTDLGGSVDCRAARYDVRIVSADRILDLEAQTYPEDIAAKSLFYGAKLLTSGSLKGVDYTTLPQVTVVTLLDTKPLFPEDGEIVRTCKFNWETQQGQVEATDKICFVLVELAKVRERYNVLDEQVLSDELLSWLYLLTSGFSNEWEVEAIMEKFPTMQEFAELYGFAIDDPNIVEAYDLYEECWREQRSRQRYLDRLEKEAVERGLEKGIEQGIEQGIERGIEQGIAKGTLQERERIAQAMLNAGMSKDAISAILQEA